jgi:hypothetical protein
MKLTRVHSGEWIFDGTDYHRTGVDSVEEPEGLRFYPRVDIRFHEAPNRIRTHKTEPVQAGFSSLREARKHAEIARDEWEGGQRMLYRIPNIEEIRLAWPNRLLKNSFCTLSDHNLL